MAGHEVVVSNMIFISLATLSAAFQLCDQMMTCLIFERCRIQQRRLEVANQFNIAVIGLRCEGDSL